MASAVDFFPTFIDGPLAPYAHAAAVSPSDSNDLATVSSALFVGSGGAITINMFGGESSVTFAAVPSGTTIQVRATRVLSGGTSASSIVALW